MEEGTVMDIPQMEKMTKKDVIDYMRKCARQYVPEWRYDEEQPDPGTALVSVFADMMYDNIKKFNMSVAGDLFSFFDGINAKLLPASPAEGFAVFGLPEGLVSEAEVPAGTRLLADTEDEQLVFETQEEVLVCSVEMQRIFLAVPKEDAVYEVFSRGKDPVPSFFLFQDGTENLQRHLLFFCFGQELKINSYANVRLSLVPAGKKAEKELEEALCDPARIRFFYGAGEEYQRISDYTYQDGGLCFKIPGGPQGIAAMEEFNSQYVISAEILDGRFFSGIYWKEIALNTECRGQKPEFINVNGTDQEIEEFLAFGENPSLYDECYIGSQEIFGKTGAQISVEFDLDFVKIPIEEIVSGVKIAWKRIMRKQEFVPEEEYDITIREVIWEYYNGFGWKRLSVSSQYRDIFSVEEGLRGVRRRMEFTCPADIEPALVNSAENYCIRARIIRMNNAYKTKGAYVAPVMGNFSLSYSYMEAPLHPQAMIQQSNMERTEYRKEEMEANGFAFPACRARTEEQRSCYFGFNRPPVGGPLKFLFTMHDTVKGNLSGMKWEYLSKEGWKEMHPADGTEGFAHTGLISWYGRKDSSHGQMFGEDLYWIRLREGTGQEADNDRMNCPKIEGIYSNATSILAVETVEEFYEIEPRAEEKQIQLSYPDISSLEVRVLEPGDYTGSPAKQWTTWKEVEELTEGSGVRKEFAADRRNGKLLFPKYMEAGGRNDQEEIGVHVRYSHSRGDKGNLAAGEIGRLDRTVGFINSVVNPMATVCGLPEETVMEAVERNAGLLRHGRRCVSAKDYEDMAKEAARDVSRVKCFPNRDETGKSRPGAVTLVVLPGDYGESFYSFERTRKKIYTCLAAHMDETILNRGQFHIVMPELIRLDVKVVLELTQEKEIFAAIKRVREELERFLNPLYGNFYGNGWEIGTLPDKNQITHALKKVEGVKYISQLSLRKYRRGRFEEYEVNEERLLPFYRLPKSGFHEVIAEP
ncbi:MAG: hypothetical protein HFH50_04880 [Lachnospiraceae bacterium]|nr:hypothetical protein [Lachnospiraceae bacterium]